MVPTQQPSEKCWTCILHITRSQCLTKWSACHITWITTSLSSLMILTISIYSKIYHIASLEQGFSNCGSPLASGSWNPTWVVRMLFAKTLLRSWPTFAWPQMTFYFKWLVILVETVIFKNHQYPYNDYNNIWETGTINKKCFKLQL